jgi:hypothetical protein
MFLAAIRLSLLDGGSLMKGISLLIVIALVPTSFAQSRRPVSELKLKIEATELDRRALLQRLNADGSSHHLKFALTEQGFDYRIVFGTGQKPVGTTYGDINASAGSTAVYDAEGKEMFEFRREGRWTDSGATNAIAKEIIKRLVKLRSAS